MCNFVKCRLKAVPVSQDSIIATTVIIKEYKRMKEHYHLSNKKSKHLRKIKDF